MELEGVHAAFGEVAAGAGEGAAVAVSVDGELVVDEWGGSVDPAGRRGWKRDTLVQVFSVTKPLAATALLLLVDRGFVELDAPARRYWPELIAGATVRQLLAHQAGLPVFDTDVTPEILLDPDAAARLLAAQAPRWEPGTAHGEHALTYGYLVGEIVRRVDGRRLGRFFAEEIAGPHGLDLAIGLNPAQQARCADLRALPASGASPPGPDPASPASPARRDPHPDPDLDPDPEPAGSEPDGAAWLEAAGTTPARLGRPRAVYELRSLNSRAWRAGEVAAINGHGTARALVGFYEALRRGRILSAPLLAEATAVQAEGTDRMLGSVTQWGLGFALEPGDGYGMGGIGGSIAWTTGAEREGYTFGFVTAALGSHDRSDRIENAVRSALGLPLL